MGLLNHIGLTYKKTTEVPCEADAAEQKYFAEILSALLNEKAPSSVVSYADCVHSTHSCRSTCAWIEKCEVFEQPVVSGRDRVDINGSSYPYEKQYNNPSMRKIILKPKVLLKLQPLLQKVLLTASFAMLSSNLFAQRYRPEYDDVAPTPWWLNALLLIAILIYLWVKKKVRLSGKLYLLLSVVLVILYTLILLYKWFFYFLLGIAALGFIVYVKWGDKMDEFITKRKNK